MIFLLMIFFIIRVNDEEVGIGEADDNVSNCDWLLRTYNSHTCTRPARQILTLQTLQIFYLS